ncbi:MAG: DUF438 domain-containing protein [Thermoplasmata archaeon]
MSDKMELKDVIKTIHAYDRGTISKKESITRLKDIAPMELLKAEKHLIKQGYSLEDLNRLSGLYKELVDDRYRTHISALKEGHPIRMLMIEHVMILSILDELENLDKKLKLGDKINRENVEKIKNNLKEVEKHHLREENVLFPRLRKLGFDERVDILSKEHGNFINHELRLIEAFDKPIKNKGLIKTEIEHLISQMRFHAYIENAILYPVALNKISNWTSIKEEMEIIGFSSFSPMYKHMDDADKDLLSNEYSWNIGGQKMPKKSVEVRKVNVKGETCPVPLVEMRKAVRKAGPGDVIEVVGTHPASKKEIPMAVESMGLKLVGVKGTDEDWKIRIKIPEEE